MALSSHQEAAQCLFLLSYVFGLCLHQMVIVEIRMFPPVKMSGIRKGNPACTHIFCAMRALHQYSLVYSYPPTPPTLTISLSLSAFTDVGLIFMTVGTAEYIYHTWMFRTRLHTPPTRVWWVTGYSLAILAAWAYGASHLQRKESLWSHFMQFKVRFATYVGFSPNVRRPSRQIEELENSDAEKGRNSS